MEAGRELDALVAEKVMGFVPDTDAYGRKHWRYKHPDSFVFFDPPTYSTDIAAAWEVVEKLVSLGVAPAIYLPGSYTDEGFPVGEVAVVDIGPGAQRVYSEAQSVPLAICLAALKAVGVDV